MSNINDTTSHPYFISLKFKMTSSLMSFSLELFSLRNLNQILHTYFNDDLKNDVFITMKKIK